MTDEGAWVDALSDVFFIAFLFRQVYSAANYRTLTLRHAAKECAMKEEAWKLFRQTGNPVYYLLYKELTKDGSDNKRAGASRDGLQGKR